MHSKNHRQNHDFQIAYFLAGKCHTPDGAFAILCDLREERQAAIAHYHVSEKRQRAKEIRAKAAFIRGHEAECLEAEADLEEIATGRATGKVLFDAATDELTFIERCIEKVRPLRKYAHLPDPQAHEAMQADEWRGELMGRAQNFLLCNGAIPPDEFATMRSHPEFATAILPAIGAIREAMQSPEKIAALLTAKPQFDLPALIARSSHREA